MGLAWQQGPLASGAVGRFLVPDPLPERMLCAEPLAAWSYDAWTGVNRISGLISFEPDRDLTKAA